MKRLISTLAVLAVLVSPAWAQKIEVQKSDPNRIVRVETALNHLTVIELREPVTTVAAGSAAFKIEWRENKVFVQPTEADVATNLFIWTVSGRTSYELEPAGAVDQMHFAIDQLAPPAPAPAPLPTAKRAAQPTVAEVAPAILLNSTPIRTDGLKAPKHRVTVLLKDAFQGNANDVVIRYLVFNGMCQNYTLGTPQIAAMSVNGSSGALTRLSNTQLSESQAAKIAVTAVTPVDVLSGNLRTVQLRPGEETVGVVSVKLPAKRNARTVLRLTFPRDAKGQPTATVVL